MLHLNRAITTAAGAALICTGMCTGMLIGSTGIASARVVCNAEGDCWHTDKAYHYTPELKLEIHPDSWYFHHDWTADKDHHYRDHHDDRGYYKNGVWVTF